MASTAHEDPTGREATAHVAASRDAIMRDLAAASGQLRTLQDRIMRLALDLAALPETPTFTVVAPSTLAVHRVGNDFIIAPIAVPATPA